MQIGVLTTPPGNDPTTARYAPYVAEILAHAGIPWVPVNTDNLQDTLSETAVLVLPAHRILDPDGQAAIKRFVESGRDPATRGAHPVLRACWAVAIKELISEAWFRPTSDSRHVVTRDIDPDQPRARLRRPSHTGGRRRKRTC